MSLYSPFSTFLERTRLLFQRRVRDGQPAVLGDKDGAGARTEVPDADGYLYARFPGTPDANGNVTYSAPFIVRAGQAAFQNYPGAAVYVAIGYNGELEIVSANYQSLDQAGIDTRTLNPLHQQSKFVYLWQLTLGFASAVANSVEASFLVTVKKYLHYVNNRFQFFETGLQAAKVDLAAYMPAADMHRYAAVWVDTYGNVAEVTTSTTQSMFTPLDATDIQELVNERPPDAIPHKAFYLANNAGTVRQEAAQDVDLRGILNTPPIHGFPNPVTYRERIQPDRQVLFAGSMVVTGSLEVLGSLVGIDSGETGSTGGGGGGGWQDDGTVVRLTDTTDNVSIGGTTDQGKLAVIGDADEVQLRVQQHSSQTATTMTVLDSSAQPIFEIEASGRFLVNGRAASGGDFAAFGSGSSILFYGDASASAVGFGTGTPSDKTLYDAVSTIKGSRPAPSMTTTQRNAITSPPTALQIFNTTTGVYEYWTGAAWLPIGGGAPDDATYIVQVADGDLPNAQAMGALATGLVKNTTTTGVQSIAAAGTDYTSPTGTENLSNKTVTASTIDNTPIGTTTRALGYFSALREYIGGFAAIFTHANSADRTYTLPNYDGTLATLAGTETLTNKTLTSPILNTGPQFTDNSYFTGLPPKYGDIWTATDASGTGSWSETPAGDYISLSAFTMRKITAAIVEFGVGYCEIATYPVRKRSITQVDLATATWLLGSEAASQTIWFFMGQGGVIQPAAAGPNATDPDNANNPISTMLINQATWTGAAGLGLNATSFVYDNEVDDGDITAGMMALIYASTDTDYSLGRGRGASAAGNTNHVSAALITAINTGTKTITLEAGHNIAINNNDRVLIVPRGPLLYRYFGTAATYRLIGSMYNDGSSNLDDRRRDSRAEYVLNEAGNYTITSATMTSIDATNLNLNVLSDGSDIVCGFAGSHANTSSSGFNGYDLLVDEMRWAGDTGILSQQMTGNTPDLIAFTRLLTGLLPGTHNIKLQWRANTGTATLYAGAGTANEDVHPEFYVYVRGKS